MVRSAIGSEPHRVSGHAAGPSGFPLGRDLVVPLLDSPLSPRARAQGRAQAQESLHGESPVRATLARLADTARELRRYRQGFLMLLAFLIYNDGIGTIIRMATVYGDRDRASIRAP